MAESCVVETMSSFLPLSLRFFWVLFTFLLGVRNRLVLIIAGVAPIIILYFAINLLIMLLSKKQSFVSKSFLLILPSELHCSFLRNVYN